MTGTPDVKKVSCGSWAFVLGPYAGSPVPFREAVDRVARAGYDGVEICGLPPHVTLENCGTTRARHKLARMLGDLGLGISGYHPDFSGVSPVPEGNQQSYMDLFRRYVELCADLGSPLLRVDTVTSPQTIPEDGFLAAMNRVADTWAEAADIAAAGGIVVAWEFRPRSIFSKLSDVCVLHQKVDQPNFKILFDTANAHACCVAAAHQHGHRETSACGLPELLKKLEGRVGGIHVMDSDTLPPGAEGTTHRPFEEGVIDFRILGPQLLEAPVHWWCVDLSYCPGAWDLLESSREYVVALMAAKTAA